MCQSDEREMKSSDSPFEFSRLDSCHEQILKSYSYSRFMAGGEVREKHGTFRGRPFCVIRMQRSKFGF